MNFLERLARERRGRLAAERLLDQKKRELLTANARLSQHAQALSDQIAEQRQGLDSARHEAEELRSRTTRALAELERANAAAQVAERRLWEALETIRDGFALFDPDDRLVAANRAFQSMFGDEPDLPRGIAYGEVIARLSSRVLSGGAETDRQHWRRMMVSRVAAPGDIEPQVVDLRDGRHFRLMDRRGAMGDLVCLARDITLAVAREADLEEARARAEAASRAKSTFLANMSHEIRTPINGVVGMAELLCQSGLNEEQRLCAETIRNSGEALLAIINDVLDYSKIQAEKLKLYPEPFDLERCLHEVILLLQPSAGGRGIQLIGDFDLFLPTRFVGDRGRVRQILTNLIGNAVKFTQAGHVLTRVVGIERGDGAFELHVSVEDTGIGIAAEHLDHIFGEFSQVEDQANRQFEGTGLGLSITRQLVEMMQGSMWVESSPGHGSCFGFRFCLPAAEPVMPARAARRPVLLNRALLVSDVPFNRTILQRQIETFGLKVASCGSLEEAPATLSQCGADLIIVDDRPAAADVGQWVANLRKGGVDIPVAVVMAEGMAASDGIGVHALAHPVLRSDLFRLLEGLSYADTGESSGPPMPDSPPPCARRMRVLAAEDNRTNQLVFRKMVEGAGIDLAFAQNGMEAVDLWQAFAPDLIFMDISMPGMDGRAAAMKIREKEGAGSAGRVPIVALTAHAMAGDDATVLPAGMDGYLTKPLKKAEIIAELVRYRPDACSPVLAPAEVQPSAIA